MIDSEKNKREFFLDCLKIIAIVCVCSYHFSLVGDINYMENVSAICILRRFVFGFNSIGVPLFFIVNGALLLNKQINIKKHLKRCCKIMLQYYFWRLFTIIAICLLRNINLFSFNYNIFNMIIFFDTIPEIDISHLWFVPTLICIYVLVPFYQICFKNMIQNKYVVYSFMLILYILCFLINDILNFFPNTGLNFSGLSRINPFQGLVGPMTFYFFVGGLLYKNIDKVRKMQNKYAVMIFLVGGSSLFLEWYMRSKGTGVTWDNVFGGYTTTPTIIMSIAIFILVCRLQNTNYKAGGGIIRILGSNTMNIYYFHWILGILIFSHISLPIYGIGINFLKAILMVLVCSVIGEFLKRIPILHFVVYG